METKSLTQYYDDIKSGTGKSEIDPVSLNDNMVDISKPNGINLWNTKINNNVDKIRTNCRKRIILDIYAKILPLDDDYKDRNSKVVTMDVDNMLKQKNMDSNQYFKSAFESTKAPLLEFVLRATDRIAKAYLEEANEVLKDAKDKNENPVIPDTDEAENQVVDITSDNEYENFVDKLKKKTVDKIVNDISGIIKDKKETEKMTFEPKQESTIGICMDYLQKNINESVDNNQRDLLMALSIREATLNQLDIVFNQPNKELKLFESMIRYGKGYIINESAKIL